ncbi:MAG: 2Fe-2S iron-sulfur cluster binding domain-containing protein [Deltaproteobacteria bacterium]|nr:2Fe-2S iron-sulfur cluster binding domain-containing protein [Deltaproteobacteria bacterium]
MDHQEVEIAINGERKIRVPGGKTLLESLKQHKIFVPATCGGRATCAYCKVKTISGFGAVLPTEAPVLSPEETRQGVRLACQVKLQSDVAIELPDALLSTREYRARTDKITDLTYDTKLFHFKLIAPATINYRAGQYIQFLTPEYGHVCESVCRSYSVCGVPTESDRVELMVRLVPEGICTTYMFNRLQEGDEVRFIGPFGDFYVRDSDRRMICIAGGSGMAPIRSMLRSMTQQEIARRKPIFFFGARAKKDLFMIEEWREFERAHPGFRFVPALSRPDPDDRWEGEVGRVTEIIDKYVSDFSNAEGYLCGSPGMLNACVDVLTKMGVPEERIYYDKYD